MLLASLQLHVVYIRSSRWKVAYIRVILICLTKLSFHLYHIREDDNLFYLLLLITNCYYVEPVLELNI